MKSIKVVITFLIILAFITILTTCDMFTLQPRANSSDPNSVVGPKVIINNPDLLGGYWDNDLPVLPGWVISTDGVYDTDANHPDPGYYDLRMAPAEYGTTGRFGSFAPWNNPGGFSVDRMEINQNIDVPADSPILTIIGSSTGYGTSPLQSNGLTKVYVDGIEVASRTAVNATDWTITVDLSIYEKTTINLSIVRPASSVTYGDVWWDSVQIE